MAVRSPSDGDDDRDADDTDDTYANAGRDRTDLPAPRADRPGRHYPPTPDPADPATAAQAEAAFACDYPTCAACSWFATTAVVEQRDTGRACVPYCSRCSTGAIADGGHECGLPGLATLRTGGEPAGITFSKAFRGGAIEVLVTPDDQHSGPTTAPRDDVTAWLKANEEDTVYLADTT